MASNLIRLCGFTCLFLVSQIAYGDEVDKHLHNAPRSEFLLPPLTAEVSPEGELTEQLKASQTEAKVARTSIVAPADGTNITAATTFEWLAEDGANAYLFRVSTQSCSGGDVINQFSIPATTTSFASSGLNPAQVYYASIWVQSSPGGSYFFRDCTTYNIDIDGDGIYNDLDPNPSTPDAIKTYQSGDKRLRVFPTGRVAILQISPEQYARLSAGNTSDFEDISNTVYEFYNDAFDFIFITNDQSSAAAGYAGLYRGVQNDTQGIGSDFFNNTARFGSDNPADPATNDGRLQGVIHFPTLTSFSGGPGLHELMHRWGNRLSSIPDGGSGSHWGFSSGGGQLGGWDASTLIDLGDGNYQANSGRPGSTSFGTFANGGNSVSYSKIELYLMGMIPANQLEPMTFATNAAFTNIATGTFTAESLITRSAQQIIDMDGTRLPDFQSSQKAFTVLNLLVTTSEPPLQIVGRLDEQAYRFGLAGDEGTFSFNFWEATNGVGTLNITTALSGLRDNLMEVEPPQASDELCVPVVTQQNDVALICL